jgi:genome maintenance exonuclease 1
LKRYEPNRLQINKRRYYCLEQFPNAPEGIVLPSVTTIASACSSPGKIAALMNWRKKVGDEEANRRTRNAVDRGNWLHGVLEDLWNGEDIQTHLDSHQAYVPYFESVMGFLEIVDSPLLVESAIAWYSDPPNEDEEDEEDDEDDEDGKNGDCPYGYSGTFDMLAKMKNGELALLDWKTSYKEKPDTQLADYRMQLGAYVQALEQMYDIEINEAHCAIAIHDPDTGHSQEAQIVSLSEAELAMQADIMRQKTRLFFSEHYPGGRPLTISMDRGA